MRTITPWVRYSALVIIVTVLGGLAGWYLFVHKQIDATDSQDSARGFGDEQSFGGRIGSTLGNLVGGVIGDMLGDDGGDSTENGAPRLWQITRTPVAGHGFASSREKLYFAERASGNILLADPVTRRVDRLTNTLIPRVHEALFAADGSVVLRGIDESGSVTSYAANIATSTSPAAGDTPNKLEGVYLPQGIVSIAARASTKSLFFIMDEAPGSAGVTSGWLGTGQKKILGSALSNWDALMLEDGGMYVVQKASDDASGYAFKVSTSGALERVLGDLPGLIILPKSGSSALLYSTASGGTVALYARTGKDTSELRLPVRTVADKCVWAHGTHLVAYCAVPQTPPLGPYLRDRYDGTTHTSDAWWRVDVSANTAEQIYTPEIGLALDVEDPRIDSSDSYVAFMNGADKTLWMLHLGN